MTMEVRVPQLPESVADATLVAWHKKVGDSVARDENLADLETDKVVLEVPAPVAGVIKSLEREAGTTVTSGELLAVIDEQAGAGAPAKPAPKADARKPAEAEEVGTAAAPARAAPTARKNPRASSRRRRAGWSRRTSCRRSIAGSGRDGRISKSDVAQHLEARAATPPAAAPAAGRADQRVPMSRLRARIAQRLVEAQSTAALLTTFNEVDMQALMALRARYKDAFEKRHGVRLGFMSFFAKACDRGAAALPGGERLGRGQRHRLSRVLRPRRCRLDRPRPHRPGAARRRPHGASPRSRRP